MESVFKISKQKPLIKFKDYKYIGVHPSTQGTNYYIRKYDNHNNYEFMCSQIGGRKAGLTRKYILEAGTYIKVIDSFMFSYLKHRTLFTDENKKFKKDFIKISLKENGFVGDKMIDLYSNRVPTEIAKNDEYQKMLKDDYNVLYVKNTESLGTKYNTVTLVMYKEVTQSALGWDLSYVVFDTLEFATKPSYVKEGKGDKYLRVDRQTLAIPTNLLK